MHAIMLDAMHASRYAIGEDSFVEKTEQRLGTLRTGSVQDQHLALPAVTVDSQTVDACVARHFAVEAADLNRHGHRAGPAKVVAVELACRLTGKSGRAVGMHYGGITGAAVANIRRRVREGQIAIPPEVDRLMSRIRRASDGTSKV